MTKTYTQALEDFEYAVRCNCQCCVTDAEATTDAQVNEAKQKVLDAAQADVDAAVAAVVEEAAEGFDSIAGMIAKHTWDTPEGESIKLFLDDGPHSGPAVDWISKTLILLKRLNIQYAEEIRALIPTDALAERDAKVRADALQEFSAEAINAVGFTLAHFDGELRPDGTPHEKETAVKLLKSLMQTLMPEGEPFEALIEGEA